jgi:UDP-2,4-diacetamido-2,4,6-trideoxy-beta-L-altropyranose hydrolase
VIFRADGNSEIGYGHFIRTLGIAGLIKDKFYCVYVTLAPTEYQLREIEKVCNEVIILKDPVLLSDEFLQLLSFKDIVVLDNYNFSSDYQLKIKERGCVVIYIDDFNDKHYVCDTLINNIPGFTVDDFDKEAYTELCLGSDYALLRKEFFDRTWRLFQKEPKKIFISFGGSDIYNLSEKIIKYLLAIDASLELNLLIGEGYRYVDTLKLFTSLVIHRNISADKVALLIATSNVCIVPASSLVNEVSSIGSRLMIGYFANNQIKPYEYFVKNNLAIGLGDYRSVSFEEFKTKFIEILDNHDLIGNQRAIYQYQQEKKLKNIFYKYERQAC